MLIFSLAPIFPNMKNSLISSAGSIWGMNPTFAMGIAYSLGIGLIFLLIQPAALHRAAQVMSMATAALFAFWVTVPTGLAGPIVQPGPRMLLRPCSFWLYLRA